MLVAGRRKRWLAAGAVAVAFLMAACSSSSPSKTFQSPPTGPPANGGPSVQQQDFSFTPASIDVKAGASVTVSLHNVGTATHTFTISSNGINAETVVQPGSIGTVTFTVPASATGTIQFFCRFHVSRGMKGTLNVT